MWMLFHYYDWISVPLVYTQVTWFCLFISCVRGLWSIGLKEKLRTS